MLGQVLYGFIQQGVVNFHEFLVQVIFSFNLKGKKSVQSIVGLGFDIKFLVQYVTQKINR